MADNKGHTHTIMPKKLAQALMESSVQHFAAGGGIGGFFGNLAGTNNPNHIENPSIYDQNFMPAIQGNQQHQQEIYGQQSNLANQLMKQSQGEGPNPALSQLNQTTAQNVQNQGAMMASQRGASSNPALMARQAAMQGANTQQQATGQAATLGAQQQLAAQQQLSSLYGTQANQALQGESIEQGGFAALNSAKTTGQLGASGLNAQTAAQNSGANAGLFGGIMNGVGGAFAMSRGGVVPKMSGGGSVNTNYAVPSAYTVPNLYPRKNSDEAKQAASNAAFQKAATKTYDYFSNPGQSADVAKEGYLDADAKLGVSGVDNAEEVLPAAESLGAEDVAALGAGDAAASYGGAAEAAEAGEAYESGEGIVALAASKGGMIPLARRLPHYGDGGFVNDNIGIAKYGDADQTPQSAQPQPEHRQGLLAGILNQGGQIPFSRKLLSGGKVPGKPKVSGDSEKNDTEPTMLSPGEVVLPRSVTMAKDAPRRAMEFMRHLQAKKKSGSYGDVIKARKLSCGGKV